VRRNNARPSSLAQTRNWAMPRSSWASILIHALASPHFAVLPGMNVFCDTPGCALVNRNHDVQTQTLRAQGLPGVFSPLGRLVSSAWRASTNPLYRQKKINTVVKL